jgi:hypothetical protein
VAGFFDVYYKVQQSPGSIEWSDWIPLPGGDIRGNIAVARDADGKLEVFARGGNNKLFTNMQTTPNSNTWTGWTSLGGWFTTDPVVITRGEGNLLRLVVFGQGAFFQGVYQEQGNTSGGWTNTWRPLGGDITSRLEAVEIFGVLHVFAKGGNNTLLYGVYAGPQSWSGWTSLGGYVTSDIFADNVFTSTGGGCGGYLRVYAAGGNHTIFYREAQYFC